MADVKVTAYGGAGQIGGNKILLEDGGLQVLLDFGLNFEDLGRYYADFMQPRASNSGTYDYLMMDLLPPLMGLYRQDAEVEQLGPLAWERAGKRGGVREVDPLGVLVSHAHVDHTGLISFIRPDVPIVSSAMTAVIAKSMQDTGQGGLDKEVVYWNRREDVDEALRSDRKADFELRPWLIHDAANWTAGAQDFWSQSSRATKKVTGAEARPFGGSLGPLKARAFAVDHSIMGAAAYAIETDAGWVVYSGDVRVHGARGETSRAFAELAAELEPVALLCEATRAGGKQERSFSEADVLSHSLAVTRREEGLVVADFGPRNVERLLSFLEVAEEAGRELVILAKDAHLLSAMATASKEIPDPLSTERLMVYRDREDRPDIWKREVLDRYAEKVVDWKDVAARPGNYILCLSYYDLSRLLDINPERGSYIYSTSEPYTEEQEIDLARLGAWLDRLNLTFVGDPRSKSEEDKGFHASGHASEEEIVGLIKAIAPKMVVPIHTHMPQRIAAALEGSGIRVESPEKGKPIAVRED